jgi:hypothetical protein
MSGFLQRLALRDSGALPVLKPRVPGLFEPAAGLHAPAGEDHGDRHDSADAVPAPRGRGMTPVDPMAEYRQPQPAHAAQSGAAGPVRAVPVTTPAVADRLPEPAPAAARGAPPLSPQAARALALQARPDTSQAAITPAMSQPVSQLAARAALSPAGERPQVDQQSDGWRREHHDDAGGPASERLASQAPALTGIPTPSVAAAIRAARAAEPRPAREAAPVVQVTIGRVEVRASQGAAAPVRQANRQQPTSLDDYLRNREGRR